MSKKEYDHQWYMANRSYKKTYARFNYRAKNAEGRVFKDLTEYARDALVIDRKSQIRNRRWLDERNGFTYVGVGCPLRLG